MGRGEMKRRPAVAHHRAGEQARFAGIWKPLQIPDHAALLANFSIDFMTGEKRRDGAGAQ